MPPSWPSSSALSSPCCSANVLELSEKYQKCFDPLRYFVAGFLKFLCLPKYHFELEYLPTTKDVANSEGKVLEDQEQIDMTVQSLSSQVVAPKAEHDDDSLDLLLSMSRYSTAIFLLVRRKILFMVLF
ncbi:hypothetical protein COCNU_scaffold004112G000060 [Cocos nucifera]|nr:hypothetical protein [Cocos nucifera]